MHLTPIITRPHELLLLQADLGTGRVDDDVGWRSRQPFTIRPLVFVMAA